MGKRNFANAGHRVYYRTAAYLGVPAQQDHNGIRFSRGGNRITVYPRALAALVCARWGRGPLADMGVPDVIIDTQNGVPFFAHLVSPAPVIILEHPIHHRVSKPGGTAVADGGHTVLCRFRDSQTPAFFPGRHEVKVRLREELVFAGVGDMSVEGDLLGGEATATGMLAQFRLPPAATDNVQVEMRVAG